MDGLRAQTIYTWTGAGSNSYDISAADNWLGGVAPAGLATDTLVFGKSLNPVPSFTASQTVGNIIYTGQNTSTWLMSNTPALVVTLAGNIASSPLFSYFGSLSATLALTNAPHTMNIEGSFVYLMGDISGAGSLVKTGGATLGLKGNNTFTGGVTINQGTVMVGTSTALGAGQVTFNGGILASESETPITLANNFLLGTNPTFGLDYSPGAALTLTGTLAAIGPTANLSIVGDTPLYLSGNIVDGTAGATTYLFSGGGLAVLAGTNTYTGGTTIGTAMSGGGVLFATSTAIPAAGTIKSTSQGYAGLLVPSAVATFVSRLDPTGFTGTLGFDTPPGNPAQTFSAAINLTNLPDTARVGTLTQAILTGEITPRSATTPYSFGGAGWLYLSDATPPLQPFPLTGTRDLHASTLVPPGGGGTPFMLVVSRGNNTYTGGTSVSSGGIVFDAVGALPANSAFFLGQPGSYLGHTETDSSLTVANLVTRLTNGSYVPESVLGFDSHDYINRLPAPVTRGVADINLGSLLTPIYIGTASAASLNGNITTTTAGGDDYFFTGYAGGILTVNTALSGNKKVWVGLPADIGGNPSSEVRLTQNNTYSGGTMLNAGTLYLNQAGSLGTGALSVAPWTDSVVLATGPSVTTLSNPIVVQYGDLTLSPSSATGLTLTGLIMGDGHLIHRSGILTLSNDNTFTGGIDITNRTSKVIAGTNTALGTGLVYLSQAANLDFTTMAPVIGGLGGGEPFSEVANVYSSTVTLLSSSTLTISQLQQENFAGTIQGLGAAIVKTGPGKLGLSGNNTYTGGTTIVQGKLVAGSNTALGTGPVVINGGTLGAEKGVIITNPISFGASGGLLGGGGIIGGNLSIGPLIGIAPGDSPGTLTFIGNLTWAPGGSYNLEVLSATGNMPGTSFDTIVVTGGASLTFSATSGAKFNLNLLSLSSEFVPGNVVDFNGNNSYSWQIASSASPILGFSADAFSINTTGTGNFTNPLNGGIFSASLGTAGGNPFAGDTAIFLNFTPVPEPSTWALLLSGLGTLVLAWRRRR